MLIIFYSSPTFPRSTPFLSCWIIVPFCSPDKANLYCPNTREYMDFNRNMVVLLGTTILEKAYSSLSQQVRIANSSFTKNPPFLWLS